MRIISLEVEGFRSLRDCAWKPGDLNLLIGPNAGGKSNLLSLLELISVSARGRLGEHVQRQGGMEPLLWNGASEAISIRLQSTPAFPDRDAERDQLTYELRLARRGRSSSFSIVHELLGSFWLSRQGQSSQPFKFIERDRHRAVIFDEKERRLQAPDDAIPEEESALSMASGPFVDNQVVAAFQKQLASWSVFHGLETGPSAPIRQPAISRSELQVNADGSNCVQVLHTLYTSRRDFRREIDQAMRSAFGDEYEALVFPPDADHRIQMRVQWRSLSTPQSAASLSDGTLRFLFLLAILANPEPPSLLAIDEPEIGLHPSMLPIVAEYAAAASERAQVLLTTHSPDLLTAFGRHQPTTTIVELSEGSTALRVVAKADLAYWLGEYSLGEMFRSGELESLA